MDVLETMVGFFEEFLGPSKNGASSDGQVQFCCPRCAEEACVESDGKYNLEVNLLKGVYQCWKCSSYDDSMKGHINRLISRYGGYKRLAEYKRMVRDIREIGLYQLDYFEKPNVENAPNVALPKSLKEIYLCKDAKKYLEERHIDETIINKFGIKATPTYLNDREMKGRIVIPSYDEYGFLNYWVARDYLGDTLTRPKYMNPKVDKKTIIFNESNINWDMDVTIVEGPFDMISCVPNSVPTLGKSIDSSYALYNALQYKLNANVNIFYDGDAFESVKKAYAALNVGNLYGRVRYVPVENKMDPNDILMKEGREGVIKRVTNARQFTEAEIASFKF